MQGEAESTVEYVYLPIWPGWCLNSDLLEKVEQVVPSNNSRLAPPLREVEVCLSVREFLVPFTTIPSQNKS